MNRRFTNLFLSLILLPLFLVGCGTSKEEVALKANCDRIFKNLQSMSERPKIFKDSDYADDDSIALLLGKESRQSAEKEILKKFPFLDKIIVGKPKDKQQIDLYYYPGTIFLIAQSLKGTDIAFPYSNDEMLKIAVQKNGWEEIVSPLASKTFGNYLEPDNSQGCTAIDRDRAKENSDMYESDLNTSVAFSQASDLYLDFAEFLQAIRNCEISGWHSLNRCSAKDYVSKQDNHVPSTELTEEERAILAEREADAQRKAQNPGNSNSYSNARPGQVCTNFGEVVQTEKYGSLTCKLVWLNKIKALVWMRS